MERKGKTRGRGRCVHRLKGKWVHTGENDVQGQGYVIVLHYALHNDEVSLIPGRG